MTKQVRDWQEDMEMDSPIGYSPPESMEHPIIAMLKKQYEAEKERADKAEAREKKLREAIEAMMPGMWDGMKVHLKWFWHPFIQRRVRSERIGINQNAI
ncbi:hypothetical protein HMSSN139_67460 [Paenibacillus sp. HMSSN-139]|nr:hypothetical protein HMSSN139_67460 [Paenibacillus sp. HMSSN-139]